jgi:hypothetical protein
MAEGQLDPRRATHIAIVGRKGTGKSVLAKRFWSTYPFDRLVIDPTGDVDPGPPSSREDPPAEELAAPLPTRWPKRLDDKRQTLRFAADPGSASYEEDLDRAAGLAFTHGNCLLWVDEVGELTQANKTGPAMRRILQQGRHRNLSVLFCGPRPINLNPLVISQADYLAVFHTPNPADRKRLADMMGLELEELEAAHAELVEHGYLWWDAVRRELEVRPPLPHGAGAKPSGQRFTA